MSEVKNTALLNKLMSANEEITETVRVERLEMDVTVRALKTSKMRELTVQATFPDGKGGKKINETLLNELMLENSIVGPKELFDKELMKSLGAKNVGEVLEEVLLLGEMQKVQEAFQQVNGVSDEAIVEAKN